LSDRTSHGRLAVVSVFVEDGEPSTAGALTVLRTAVGEAGSRLRRPVLVVLTADDEVARKSLRNVPRVRVLDSGQLNTYDVLACDHVVFTQAALAEFVARTGGGEPGWGDKPPGQPARAAQAQGAPRQGREAAGGVAREARGQAARGARRPGEAGARPAGAARPKGAAGESGEHAAKPARAARPKGAAGESGEPAAKPARAARPKGAAGESGEPAAKPARAARPKGAA